jgi:hypothetical protein
MMGFRTTLGAAVAGAAMLVAFGAGTAQATPYGYAESDFETFTITLGGAASLSNGAITVNTSQNYPGSPAPGNTVTNTFNAPGNAGVGATANNAYGGPNSTFTGASPPAVGANNNLTTAIGSPIVGESTLKGGFGAQSAASVGSNNVFTTTGNSIPGDASYDVVENGGLMGGGALTATGSQVETVYTVTTGVGGGTIDFSFLAQANAEALTTQGGETASASTTNVINAFLCSGTATDCGSATLVDQIAPVGLQLSVQAGPTTGDEKAGTANFLGLTPNADGYVSYDTGPLALAPDSVYEFGLASTSTESTSSIPEPMSLAVLGSGLFGLGAAVRRRRKA